MEMHIGLVQEGSKLACRRVRQRRAGAAAPWRVGRMQVRSSCMSPGWDKAGSVQGGTGSGCGGENFVIANAVSNRSSVF